jgi:hypothetical protein
VKYQGKLTILIKKIKQIKNTENDYNLLLPTRELPNKTAVKGTPNFLTG